MIRNKWTFEYAASEIAEAAKKRAEYHRKREAHWKAEREASEQKIRDAGVQMDELEVSGGRQFNVDIDRNLKRRYETAASKEAEHQDSAEEYEKFARALELRPEQRIELDVDDVRYFGL